MQKVWFVLFILIVASEISNAQNRYSASLFDEILTETYTYATKDGENLDLDIYLPFPDAEDKRATLVFVHGGGFSGGTRNGEQTKHFCTQMAEYGYVVASISYRLTRKGKPEAFGCDCPVTDKLNTFQMAVEDLQDATYFLIENREQFGIDPLKIILAGSSAGAETVLNTAYQPPYCYGLDSGPVSFAGVISFAGAIPDTVKIYNESAIPSLLFHGTDDNLVPYASAAHHYCDKNSPGYLVLHGSHTISQKLAGLNVPYWLHTTCGGKHEVANTPITEYLDVIREFCYNFVIEQNGKTKHTVVPGKQSSEYPQFNFCNE